MTSELPIFLPMFTFHVRNLHLREGEIGSYISGLLRTANIFKRCYLVGASNLQKMMISVFVHNNQVYARLRNTDYFLK